MLNKSQKLTYNLYVFLRHQNNPIFIADPTSEWQSLKVYNPGIFLENGVYHMFYNAVGDDWTLRIGKAESVDGVNFIRNSNPILVGDSDYDIKGVMDPRITKIGETYYMTYSADDGNCRKLAIASSMNLVDWKKHGLMLTNWDSTKAGGFRIVRGERLPELPERSQRSKAGGIFPRKIKGKFTAIFGNSNLWLATSSDGIKYEADFEPLLQPRGTASFDNLSVHGGPPPIYTEKGWLVFYHGRSLTTGDYKLGNLLLDLENPRKILFRSNNYILSPEEKYETFGIVDIVPGGYKKMKDMNKVELENYLQQCYLDRTMPRVVFCCGAVLDSNLVNIYYGASDTYVCKASCRLETFLSKNE